MELGLGLYRFRENADKLIEVFLRQGGKILDAAPNYSNGEALALISGNQQAKQNSGNLRVWSKVGFPRCSATLSRRISSGIIAKSELVENHALSPRLIRCQLNEIRDALGNINLDAMYLHNPERQLLRLSRKEFWILMADCVREIEQACVDGLIRHWGISVWNGFDVERGGAKSFSLSEWESLVRNTVGDSHHFRLVQMPLSLSRIGTIADFVQNGSGVIKEAVTFGKILVASSPMHGGALPPVLNREFTEVFGREVSPGQACLLFLGSIPAISACLISPSDSGQLIDSLAATEIPPLSREALCRLTALLIES